MTAVAEPLLRVQSGPRNARTDPVSGLRLYTWQGQEYPSVTSVRRMAGVPHGLHQWAIGRVIERALGNLPEMLEKLREDPAQLAVLRRYLRNAATDERDKAASLGTAVHDAAAERRSLVSVPPEIRPRLAQFYDFLEQSGAEVLASEFQCWNLSAGYAGTADLLVKMRDGSIWCLDIKTGRSTYAEYALQLMAYVAAEFVGEDDKRDDDLTALLHQVSGMAVLHLGASFWEFRQIRADAETWAAFRGLLEFARWMAAHPRVEDVTVVSRKRGEV